VTRAGDGIARAVSQAIWRIGEGLPSENDGLKQREQVFRIVDFICGGDGLPHKIGGVRGGVDKKD